MLNMVDMPKWLQFMTDEKKSEFVGEIMAQFGLVNKEDLILTMWEKWNTNGNFLPFSEDIENEKRKHKID